MAAQACWSMNQSIEPFLARGAWFDFMTTLLSLAIRLGPNKNP
jgi:hypothetical protein